MKTIYLSRHRAFLISRILAVILINIIKGINKVIGLKIVLKKRQTNKLI